MKLDALSFHLIMSMCIEATTSSSGDNSNLNGLQKQRSKLSEVDVLFNKGKNKSLHREDRQGLSLFSNTYAVLSFSTSLLLTT